MTNSSAGSKLSDEGFSAERVKHLEMVQAVVARLANNSFLIKGWALTVSAGFIAILAGKQSWKIALASLFPVVAFWMLDTYFLQLERAYRHLYDAVRKKNVDVDVFSMDISSYLASISKHKVMFSISLRWFYLTLFLVQFGFFAWLFTAPLR